LFETSANFKVNIACDLLHFDWWHFEKERCKASEVISIIYPALLCPFCLLTRGHDDSFGICALSRSILHNSSVKWVCKCKISFFPASGTLLALDCWVKGKELLKHTLVFVLGSCCAWIICCLVSFVHLLNLFIYWMISSILHIYINYCIVAGVLIWQRSINKLVMQ